MNAALPAVASLLPHSKVRGDSCLRCAVTIVCFVVSNEYVLSYLSFCDCEPAQQVTRWTTSHCQLSCCSGACNAPFLYPYICIYYRAHVACRAGELVHAAIRLCSRLGPAPSSEDIEVFLRRYDGSYHDIDQCRVGKAIPRNSTVLPQKGRLANKLTLVDCRGDCSGTSRLVCFQLVISMRTR